MKKAPEAFRTIGEVAELLETPAHVLRFWESKFYQIRPVKRAGGRRYYRPDDVALIAGIRHLLQDKGMTIRGVQKMLQEEGVRHVAALAPPLSGAGADASEGDDAFDAGDAANSAAEGGPVPEPAEALPRPATVMPFPAPPQPAPRAAPAASVPAPGFTPAVSVPAAGGGNATEGAHPPDLQSPDRQEPAHARSADAGTDHGSDVGSDVGTGHAGGDAQTGNALPPLADNAPAPRVDAEPLPPKRPEPAIAQPITDFAEPAQGEQRPAQTLRLMPRGTLGARTDRLAILAGRIDRLLDRMSEASGAGRW